MSDSDFVRRTLELHGIRLPVERAEFLARPGGLFTNLSVLRSDLFARNVRSFTPPVDVRFDEEG